MPRQGREFELLVKRMEVTLKNRGVIVKSPESIIGKSGAPNDIDVSIRGKLQCGTIDDYLIIVQCRERRKKGDIIWLREIKSIKEDVGAIRAVAVHSRGFTRDAIKFARENNIILRTLSQLNGPGIASLFDHISITLSVRRFIITQLHVKFVTDDKEDFTVEIPCVDTKESVNYIDVNTPTFTRKDDGKMDSIVNIFSSVPEKDVSPDGKRARQLIRFDSTNLKHAYFMRTSKGDWDIEYIEIEADLWVEDIACSLKHARMYCDITNNKVLAETASFELNGTAGKGVLHVNAAPDIGKLSLELKYNENPPK